MTETLAAPVSLSTLHLDAMAAEESGRTNLRAESARRAYAAGCPKKTNRVEAVQALT